MNRKRLWMLAAVILMTFGMTVYAAGEDAEDEVTVVEANTTGKFLKAIGDNTTIVLAPGVYNVTEYIESADVEEWLDESSMVKDLKAVGGSKSQLREAFAEYNPRLQPLAEQVFGGFAARCNTYAQSLR